MRMGRKERRVKNMKKNKVDACHGRCRRCRGGWWCCDRGRDDEQYDDVAVELEYANDVELPAAPDVQRPGARHRRA